MALAHQHPDAQWQRMVQQTLTHRVTLLRIGGSDEFAQPTYHPGRSGVRCYIDGTTRRVLDSQRREVQAQWQVMFEGTLGIAIDDQLEDGMDIDGNLLLAKARIISLDDNISSRDGRLLRTDTHQVLPRDGT